MRLKKHAKAKLAAIAASLFALITTLALVQRNPPASTGSDTQAQPAATATAGNSTSSRRSNSARSSAAAPATHARTHVS